MNAIDIQEIEKKLGKKLPESYKKTLINYPDFLLTAGAPANTVCELSLMNSVEEIIQLNLELLEVVPPLPKEYIAIGIDGCGNFYFISTVDQKVYFLDHECPKFKDEEETIFDFVKTLTLEANSVQEYTQELINFWSQE